VDKLRVAALEAVLRLYEDPDRLAERLPVLRHMTRSADDIETAAQRLLPAFVQAFEGVATASIAPCESEVGSGSLPSDKLQSFAIALQPTGDKRKATTLIEGIAKNCRELPVPVIGRVRDGRLFLDLRCLEDEAGLADQLNSLNH